MLKVCPSPTNATLYSLKVEQPRAVVKGVPLETDRLRLGSDAHADITLEGEGIRPFHFELVRNQAGYLLRPGEGPLMLNGRKISKEVNLKDGDTFTLDNAILTFQETAIQEEPVTDDTAIDASRTQYMPVLALEAQVSRGRLIGISGSVKGNVFEFQKERQSVGRDPSNDLCIESDGLSRAHAVIEVGDVSITVMDFNSTNGTFVNGKKVTNALVEPGNIVQFANAGFRYELPGARTATPGKKVRSLKLILAACIAMGVVLAGVLIGNQMRPGKIIPERQQELLRMGEGVKSEPQGPERDLLIATEALDSGQVEEAALIVAHILEDHPRHAAALLLQGKVTAAREALAQSEAHRRGLLDYQANQFAAARKSLETIKPGSEHFADAHAMLEQLNRFPETERILTLAQGAFLAGDLERVRDQAHAALEIIPVLKDPVTLLQRLENLENILKQVQAAEASGMKENLGRHLQSVLQLVPEPEYHHHQWAKRRMSELTTGRALKVEVLYAQGVASLATRDYGQAYSHLLEASQLDPELIKIKIALAETRQKRQKILAHFYRLAQNLGDRDLGMSRALWLKIVNLGPEENPYHDVALKHLEQVF